MPALLNQLLLGQYEAALSMLKDAIRACTFETWEAKIANDTARFTAFHTLFWTDMYLGKGKRAFEPHELVTEGRGVPYGTALPEGTLPAGLTQERSLDYVDFCIEKARRVLIAETDADLAGDNWFGRPFSRAEMHVYNIRHIQHHTGAIGAHVRRLQSDFPHEGMDWIDSGTTQE